MTDDLALHRRRRPAAAPPRRGRRRLAPRDEIVLVGAGEPIHVPGRADITYPFVAHSEYYWLTDRNRPGGVLAFDPGRAGSTSRRRSPSPTACGQEPRRATPTAPPRTICRRGCAGARRPPGRLAGRGPVEPSSAPRRRRPTDRAASPATDARRPKDAVELERMRAAQRATRPPSPGRGVPRRGVSERRRRSSSRRPRSAPAPPRWATTRSSARGPNAAVLHFMPTGRVIRHGELVLIDAGAQQLGYASGYHAHVTRSAARPTPQQASCTRSFTPRSWRAIERVTPGIEWREVHRTAALTIAEGLVAAGILRGDPSRWWSPAPSACSSPTGSDTWSGSASETPASRCRAPHEPPPYPNLRIDLPLEPGMVVTVEPGIYFVPALLHDPERRARHRDEVDWDRVDRMLGFGGIRIEDNLLVPPTAPR